MYSPPKRDPAVWNDFLIGLALPLIGVIFGLINAFSQDPEKKQLAGYNFAGAVLGLFLGYLFWFVLLPMMNSQPPPPQ